VLALGMGLLAALAWGVHDLCVRTVSRRADIPACLAGVFTVGLVLMLPFGVWRAIVADPGGTVTIAERSMSLWSGLGVGVLFALANYALYRAFAAGPVRLVAPITAAYPVVTVGLAALAGQSVSVASWLAIAVVIVGIALVASGTPAGEAAFSRRVVIGWAAAAAIGYALTFSSGQHLSASGDPFLVLVVTRAVALLTVGLFMLGTGGLRLPPRDTWPLIVLMAAMDVLALGMVFGAGVLPDAAFATVTASMFGVVTIVLARLVFEELLVPRQWFGVLVAFAAIGWLAARSS